MPHVACRAAPRGLRHGEADLPDEDTKPPVELSELDPDFADEIAQIPGGEYIRTCFQCGTCTAGCPIRAIDERYNPRKIIRMALLGMRDKVLSSDFIWLCSSCYTCQERCPQDVRITDLMAAIRTLAVRYGHFPRGVAAQVSQLRKFGRMYQIEDFDNKKRERAGLPPLPTECDEIAKLFDVTGLSKLIEGDDEG